MAGAAVAYRRNPSDRLEVLTLTINNHCNLQCPHCYLQYDGVKTLISDGLVSKVLEGDYKHLAIVGKEPLVDARSVEVTQRLIIDGVACGKSVSLITNGHGLHRLAPKALESLAWLDVSFDGGPATYSRMRKADYSKVLGKVKDAQRQGAQKVNAMHTLSSLNLDAVDDMMHVDGELQWEHIIFSPVMLVRNHGSIAVSEVNLQQIISALCHSDKFMSSKSARLLVSADAFRHQGLNDEEVGAILMQSGLAEKVLQLEHDPLRLGYLRLTYDGYLLTPNQSLHPADYWSYASKVGDFVSVQAGFKSLMAA